MINRGKRRINLNENPNPPYLAGPGEQADRVQMDSRTKLAVADGC